MKSFVSTTAILYAIFAVVAPGLTRAAGVSAPTHSVPLRGPHDGIVTRTQAYVFETVFASDGICLYLFDARLAPMMMQRLKATATVTLNDSVARAIPLKLDSPKEGEKTLYFCPMHPAVAQMEPGKCEACGGMDLIPQDRLRGMIDLPIAAGAVTAVFVIKGLKGTDSDVAFTAVRPERAKR